jgi:ligand-binding sensor domain-containing protein
MARNRLLVYLLLSLFCLPVLGQSRSEYSVINYDETSGLQSSSITCTMQDSRGYLWFGTPNGLNRYDGYVFKTFRKIAGDSNSLPGNSIIRLAEDRDGKIWIGLLKTGLCSYDPATGVFKHYPVTKVDKLPNTTPSISMLYVDKENNVWAGLAQWGVVKLNKANGSFEHFDIISDTSTIYSKEYRGSYNSAYAMYEEKKGIYWLATHDGLYRYDATAHELHPVRAKPIAKEEIRDDLFGTIVPDKDGLWLGSWAGGLSHYNLTTGEWSNYKFADRNKNIANSNIIHDLKPRNENELWIASSDKGLGYFNKTTHSFFFFNDDSVYNKIIPGKLCLFVMEDNQHNIWLTHLDGLSRIREKERNFIYVPVQVNKSDNGGYYGVSAMLEEKSGKYLLIATSFADGLHVVNRKTGEEWRTAFEVMPLEENVMDIIDMIQDSKGVIWVLTRDNLYQYDIANRKFIDLPQPDIYRKQQPSNYYKAITEDKKGMIWVASSRNGIYRFDPVQKTYRHFYNDPADKNSLPSNVVRAIVTDSKGRIWAGGTRGCFGYFNDSLNRFLNVNQSPQGDAPEMRVYTLYADRDGDVWAGTDIGLFYYDTKKEVPVLKSSYNADNGLQGEATAHIGEDKEGNIWCNTTSAVCRIRKETGAVTTFGKLDGIARVNTNGIFLFRDGNMALFTYAGYYAFNPASFRKKSVVVPLKITSFKVDDKEQYFEPQMAAHEKVIVPAGINVISFEFAALDFNRPDKQEYAYMLEGFDKDWVVAGQRRYAGYANIPGGDYVFKVRATSTPGSWDSPVVSIPIFIKQPIYKTWWFLLSVIVAFGTSLYLFYRTRLEKQQQILMLETKAQLLEKEKTLVMYENLKQHLNPHFLFNSLTSLSSLIRIDQKMAGNFLDRMSKIYRYILKNRDSEVVALSEELKFVKLYIDLQTTRFEKGLQINIDIDEEHHHRKIAPVTLQNLVENAIKHNLVDIETPLVIDLYIENDYLVVRNNLQKKNFVETSNKQGLANMLSLYNYLSAKPMMVQEDKQFFTVKIPLI